MAERIAGLDGRAKAYRPLSAAERSAALEAALAAYGRDDFFAAHELLEPAWLGSTDPAERDLYQGIIKLSAAFVHAARGNPTGMARHLAGAHRHLLALRDAHGAAGERAAAAARIDLEALIGAVEATLEARSAGTLSGPADPPGIPRLPR